ncbi:MAG: hypothetical protein H0U42_05230, partial [Thermoleophilaceae bacterium]|nr:hypothetical protein [Thermoleophilaceae bacterium]
MLAAVAVTQQRPVPSAGLLAGADSPIGAATVAQETALGSEPIIVLVGGDVADGVLQPQNLLELIGLEGKLAQIDGVRAVFGPGTFINQTIVQLEEVISSQLGPIAERADRAAEAARRRA